MRKTRLLWQFFFAYFAISASVLLLVGLFAAYTARELYLDDVQVELERDARLINTTLAEGQPIPAAGLEAHCLKLGHA